MPNDNFTPLYEPETEIEKVAEALDVDESARRAADAHRPTEEQVELEGGLEKIDIWARERADKLFSSTVTRLKELHHARHDIRPRAPDLCVSAVLNTLVTDIRTSMIEIQSNMVALWLDRLEISKEVDDFAEPYGLKNKKVSYAKDRTGTLIFLAVLLIGEAVINTGFFSKGSDFGLIGGFMEALALAGGNVIASSLLGWAMRFINHLKKLFKLIGAAASAIWIGAVGMLNLFAAHYRSALEIDPDKAIKLAPKLFLEGVLDISSMQSWWLLAIGILFAVTACWKGFRIDSIYPGFAERQRRLDQANVRFSNTVGDVKDAIKDRVDIAATEIGDCFENFDDDKARLANLIIVTESAHLEYTNINGRIVNTANALLKRYRRLNVDRRIPQIQKLPPVFNYRYQTEKKKVVPNPDMTEDLSRRDEFYKLSETRDEIYDKAMEKLTTLRHKAIGDIEDFIEKVKDTAEGQFREQTKKPAI